METTYAQIKDGQPTGIHKNFTSTPTNDNLCSWLPVVYGNRNPTFDPIKEKTVASRRIENDTVIYEETVVVLPIEDVRANKLAALSAQYDNLLVSGFPVPNENYSLSLVKNDRDALVDLYTLLKESLSANLITNSTVITIADNNRGLHSITVIDYLTLVLQFGNYYQQLWLRIATANSNLASANNVDEILNIAL